MQGLGNRDQGTYITVYNGKFTLRVPEGTPGATSRVNKEDKLVHEQYFDYFEGKLIGISKRESQKYGASWNLHFVAGEKDYFIQMPYSNSFMTAFLKQLPNADLTKSMKLTPSVKEVEGKMRSSLFVEQDGTTLKHAYTKAEPNGLPDMVQVKIKGQDQWDDTDRLLFLENMVNTQIIPKLAEIYGKSAKVETAPEGLATSIDDIKALGEEEDDF
jgi:hypothetical protein